MPLILPGVFSSQPQYPVSIEQDSPFSAGLVVATGMCGALIDSISNAQLGVTGTTGMAQRNNGAFVTTSTGSTDVWSATGLPAIPIVNAVSALAIVYSAASDTTRKRAVRAAHNTSGTIVSLDVGNSVQNALSWSVQVVGATFPIVYSATTPAAGTVYTSSFSRSGTSMRIFTNGISDLGATSATSANDLIAAPDQLFLGNSSSGYPLNGGVALLLVWNRELTNAEHFEISQNPWQVFKAPKRRLWVGAAGGATVSIPVLQQNMRGNFNQQSGRFING